MPSFGDLLRQRIAALDISQAEFARRVGVSPTTISDVITGDSVPRLSKVPKWTTALHLDEPERSAFVLAWELALSPPGVRQLVDEQRRAIERLTRRK